MFKQIQLLKPVWCSEPYQQNWQGFQSQFHLDERGGQANHANASLLRTYRQNWLGYQNLLLFPEIHIGGSFRQPFGRSNPNVAEISAFSGSSWWTDCRERTKVR